MRALFFIILLLSGFSIFSFKPFEFSLLNAGFSWTMSKLLPYITLVIEGILLAYLFAKGFKLKTKVAKMLVLLVLFAAPFTTGFVLNPIYEGDFSSEGSAAVSDKVKLDEKYDLLVITIPGCPYCLASIEQLKIIKKRTPNAHILFSVCSKEKRDLELYRTLIDGKFDIALAADVEASVKLAEGHFPTFVQIKKGLPVQKWSNDQFGAGAMDHFESEVK